MGVQAATYTFVFPNAEGHYMRVMVPLLDLVNHKGADANAAVTKDPETMAYHLTASQDIKCVLHIPVLACNRRFL